MTTSIRGFGAIILAATLLAACTKREEEKVVEEKPAVFVPPAEPARAAFTPKADTTYTLVSRKANKCLQFAGANQNDSANAEIWTCNGTDAQSFTLLPVAGGYFSIVNVRSKKCLDVAGLATNDGASAQQYLCNGGPNQQWIVADGTHVNQWNWKGMSHQEFTLVPEAVASDTSAKAGKSGKDGAGGAGGKSKKKKS